MTFMKLFKFVKLVFNITVHQPINTFTLIFYVPIISKLTAIIDEMELRMRKVLDFLSSTKK